MARPESTALLADEWLIVGLSSENTQLMVMVVESHRSTLLILHISVLELAGVAV